MELDAVDVALMGVFQLEFALDNMLLYFGYIKDCDSIISACRCQDVFYLVQTARVYRSTVHIL